MKKVLNIAQGVSRNSKIIPKRAKKCWITDINGKKYIDMTSGIGVLSTGHSHPEIIKSVKKQVTKIVHAQQNCILTTPAHQELIEKLNGITPKYMDTIYFTNSGSEAVENAIKLARVYTKKPNIITFMGGFHGRTMGCMSLSSSKVSCRTGYSPLLSGVFTLRFPHIGIGRQVIDDLNDMLMRITSPSETAAIIIEPVLGEGGVRKADPVFMSEMRKICDKHGILLISDEVQTGIGRTGRLWGYKYFYGVEPDIITFGKGIASGYPLAGVTANKELFDSVPNNGLGGTYNGNMLAVVAANTTLDIIKSERLLVNVETMSQYIRKKLYEYTFYRLNSGKYSIISDIRCYGLMIGVDLYLTPEEFKCLLEKCEKEGLMVLTTGIDQSVRLLPPLNISVEDIDIFIVKFGNVLDEF